ELLGTNSIYEISSGGENVPVVVGSDGTDSGALLGNTITNGNGTPVPLAYLVKESRREDYKHLAASDDGEFSVIDIDDVSDRKAEEMMAYVTKITDGSPVKASFRGGYFSSRSMIGELAVVLAVAVLLLYFILAAQFESIVQPVIILTEVIIDVAMVMLALFVCGESLNIMSMIGMIVACGIIINDSILKVDTINRLYRRRGQGGDRSNASLLRAVVVAGHRRLKPIVMTSLTTVLAIVPFLHRGDMGSALQYPLSFAIIVGMTVGTMVSLFFVPLMYYLIYRRR
ncbi:MAG: efflux RND transporter permease subunit, partial [Prevotella sp.]|nr:efflux RND transporter permease subunit [Prevotella sp.]